ncbi:MAG: hypothetical protein M3299_10755 [Thermoproteota archaeon]|nr:hypothetical protein [Thermoproteota archaeon]
MKLISQKKSNQSDLSFEIRATAALGISVVADALDYIGAPIFALPIVGDVADAIVMALLYRLTGSKTSTAISSIEFIPVIGDMIPAYTISTLLWILRESHKRKDNEDTPPPPPMNSSNHTGSITRIDDHIDHGNIVTINSTTHESLRTKAMRLYAIFRSRMH